MNQEKKRNLLDPKIFQPRYGEVDFFSMKWSIFFVCFYKEFIHLKKYCLEERGRVFIKN